MKKVFTFDMDKEGDREEFEHHNKAIDYYLSLIDIRDYLRELLKYSDKGNETHREIYSALFEILKGRGIEL
jgi:hypothetical protein